MPTPPSLSVDLLLARIPRSRVPELPSFAFAGALMDRATWLSISAYVLICTRFVVTAGALTKLARPVYCELVEKMPRSLVPGL